MHSNQTESRVFCARDFVAPTYTLKGSTMTQSSPQRPRSTWTVLAALALVGVGIEAGCMTRPSDGEQLSEEAQDALRGMLEDAWPDVISLHLEAARAATVSLAEATSDWSADPTSTEARAAAKRHGPAPSPPARDKSCSSDPPATRSSSWADKTSVMRSTAGPSRILHGRPTHRPRRVRGGHLLR